MKLNLKIQALNVCSSGRVLVTGCDDQLLTKTLPHRVAKTSNFLNSNNHEITRSAFQNILGEFSIITSV